MKVIRGDEGEGLIEDGAEVADARGGGYGETIDMEGEELISH